MEFVISDTKFVNDSGINEHEGISSVMDKPLIFVEDASSVSIV